MNRIDCGDGGESGMERDKQFFNLLHSHRLTNRYARRPWIRKTDWPALLFISFPYCNCHFISNSLQFPYSNTNQNHVQERNSFIQLVLLFCSFMYNNISVCFHSPQWYREKRKWAFTCTFWLHFFSSLFFYFASDGPRHFFTMTWLVDKVYKEYCMDTNYMAGKTLLAFCLRQLAVLFKWFGVSNL